MKKTMIVLLALLMAVSVFAGCEVRNPLYDGSSAASATAEPSSEPEPSEEPSEAPSEASSEAGSSRESSNLIDTLTNGTDEEKIQAYANIYGDTLTSAFSDDSMSVKIEARKAALAFVFIVHDIESDEDGIYAATFEAASASMDSYFGELAEQLRTEVDVPTASIIMEYCDKNGNVIFSKEYK